MTKNDDKRVQVLRFKGFNDDWAQRKLKDLTDVRDGTHSSPKYVEAGHPFITSKNINNGSIDYRDIKYITDEDFDEINKRSKVDIHDILMGMIGTVGNLALIDKKPNFAIKNIALIKDIGKIDYLFLYNFLQSNYVSKELIQKLDGGTQKFISLNKVRDLNISVASFQEQKAISKCLMRVNNLLILQQRKLQQLKLLKKAMLQDLFTDKNVPKLRFNGFDANWIQCKLEKEALLTMGQSPSGSTYSDQPSTYILVQGNADLKNGWVKPRIWTTQITKLAKKGDIIITVRAPAGKVGRTNFDVVLGRGVASIQGNDFIFYLLSKMDMNKYWKKYAAGSTFESINSNDIKNTRVHVPNLPEQNRIANLFLRLDDLIRFQQNKLNNLQKNKQFLLQNMFI